MAFKNRKLFFDPTVINITAFCEPYCDPIGYNDENRICPPLICKKSCPYSCTNPFPSLIPPLHPPPSPPTTTTNHQKKFLQSAHLYIVVSLSILAALCFVFSTYSIYKYYKNRNRAPPSRPPPPQDDETRDEFFDEEHGPVLDHPIWYIRTIGLQQSAINAITICKYKRGDGLVEGTECSVCLNEFQEDETLRLLPKCNHAFHLPCIDTWLRSHTNCPMCRAGIVADTAPAALPARQARPEPETENSETQVAMVENSDEEETEERAFEGEEEEETIITTSEEDLVQPVRRSVSLDCVSASMISTAIRNTNSEDFSNTQLAKSKDLKMGNGSSQREPILMMKRSVSCSGNVLMKTSSNRNHN